MGTDAIVTMQDTAVMYVAGEQGKPIAEQAPTAFRDLERKLSSRKGRKFYGVVLDGEYRACVAIDARDGADLRPIRRGRSPAGDICAVDS